jgi:hypothetical protein
MNGIESMNHWTNIFTPKGLRRMYIGNAELNRLRSWWNRDNHSVAHGLAHARDRGASKDNEGASP